ncbi:MAG: hypothetical protein A4E45_01630 [Methanosaeta sp. PtaB.Bin039]|nr:MAG: hypothetical protein A4E45_01630 [Methanosaeta sp. PtaB.Bin039]
MMQAKITGFRIFYLTQIILFSPPVDGSGICCGFVTHGAQYSSDISPIAGEILNKQIRINISEYLEIFSIMLPQRVPIRSAYKAIGMCFASTQKYLIANQSTSTGSGAAIRTVKRRRRTPQQSCGVFKIIKPMITSDNGPGYYIS